MALTVVTGRVNSGKSGTLYRPVFEAACAGEQPIVLFPSRPDAQRAAEEFAARDVSGVRTAVLDAWIAELWALHGDGRRLVERAVREVLMSRACAETPLSAISASAQRPGFVRTMAAVAERAPEIGNARPQTDEELEVTAVLERYAMLRDRAGLIEPASAAAALARNPPLMEGPVAVNRFTDLAPHQEGFVRGLSSENEVWIALPWEDGHPATEALSPLVGRLAEAGEHVHVPAGRAESELAQVERDLYRPTGALEPTGAVVFAEAAGEELECALAIDLISGLVSEGYAPGRIALVFREAARRAPLVKAAAARAGLAVEIDVARALPDTALGSALLALLDIASGRDASRERMLAFVHSPYSGMKPEEVERLDTDWRRWRSGAHRLLDDVKRSPAGGTAASLACELGAARLDRRNVIIWQSLMDALLVAADDRRGLGHESGEWDCATHREVLTVVSALAEGVEEGVTPAEVRAALERAVVATGRPERTDAVVFTEAHRVRSRRFDGIVLGGLTASEFSSERPQPVVAQLLGRLGLPAGTDERESERLLFHTISTRARSRLVLLRQGSDITGQAVRPSVFWEEMLDLYRAADGSEAEEYPAGVRRVVRSLASVSTDSLTYLPGRREERIAGERAPWRPTRGALVSEEVRDAFAAAEEFSVSELEAYSQCPYRWFVERSVRPRELDVAFEAREAGSAAHDALAAFYVRWSEGEGEPSRVTPETLPRALALMESVIDEVLASATGPVGLAETLAAGRVREWVGRTLQDDAVLLPGYTPSAHEYAFGASEGRPFELAGVALRGRIDRIDTRDGGLVVTDYKSARTVRGHGSFAAAGVIQLPVYLAAAARLLGAEPEGAVYRSLSSGSIRGFFLEGRVPLREHASSRDAVDAEALREILVRSADRVASAADGIRAGRIAPPRGGCSSCDSCGVRTTCREVDQA